MVAVDLSVKVRKIISSNCYDRLQDVSCIRVERGLKEGWNESIEASQDRVQKPVECFIVYLTL